MNGLFLKIAFLVVSLLLFPILFFQFFRILKKQWAVPETCLQNLPELEKLRPTYRKWDLLGGTLAVPLFFAGGYLGWWLCRVNCAWRSHFFEGEHILFPQAVLCLLPLVPSGIAIGMAGALFAYRVALKEKFKGFVCHGCLTAGFDVHKLIKFMITLLTLLWFLFWIMLTNTYMVFSSEKLTFSRITSVFQHSYSYDEIQKIHKITKKTSKSKNEYFIEIHFTDGKLWSNSGTEDIDEEKANTLAKYLSQKTNLPINEQILP